MGDFKNPWVKDMLEQWFGKDLMEEKYEGDKLVKKVYKVYEAGEPVPLKTMFEKKKVKKEEEEV